MKIEIIESKEKYIKLRIEEEDHTLGNILQKALLEDDRILGAGFYIPHPLRKELIFEIFFNDSTSLDEKKKIILEDIEDIKKYIERIKERTQKILEEKRE